MRNRRLRMSVTGRVAALTTPVVLAAVIHVALRGVYRVRMKELTLFQPPTRPWNTPNLSPFCTKLECYLRMVEIPYKTAAMQIGKAPKGKIPYIARADGTLVGDSQLIIEELERGMAAEGKPALDTGLS